MVYRVHVLDQYDSQLLNQNSRYRLLATFETDEGPEIWTE
jgi:hypothetical protein